MTEYALTPAEVAPGILRVFVSGNESASPPTFTGVWTVPVGVYSFTVFLMGGASQGDFEWAQAVSGAGFVNVPCSPGQEWLLEAGGPRANRGNGTVFGGYGSTPFGYDPGEGGGGASTLQLRGDAMWAVAGGRGGSGHSGGGPGVAGTVHLADTTNPVTYWGGGGAPQDGEDAVYASNGRGGGGGGWGGPAAAGGTDGAPGDNGGSYYPPSTDLGGPDSPSWGDLSIDPETYIQFERGGVEVWYRIGSNRGWLIDETPF